jgi:hypothetical protein
MGASIYDPSNDVQHFKNLWRKVIVSISSAFINGADF